MFCLLLWRGGPGPGLESHSTGCSRSFLPPEIHKQIRRWHGDTETAQDPVVLSRGDQSDESWGQRGGVSVGDSGSTVVTGGASWDG